MNKAKCLYLRSKRKPSLKQWYIDSPLRINAIRPMINDLCEEAGLPKASYRNQSRRAFSCIRMFAKHKDEKLICSISRHRSTAVKTYKHIPNNLRCSVSESIQGPILDKKENAQNQLKVNGKDVSNIEPISIHSDLEDFEPKSEPIVKGVKHQIDPNEDSCEVKDICKIISNIACKKKYKKIKFNIEFIDE